MRLIDADALKAHYAWWGDAEAGKEQKELFDEIVDLQPTVEVKIMYNPEPSIEPREPPVYGFCDICNGEIFIGERYYRAHGDTICHWCFEDFRLHEYIAGEDDE